MANYSSIIMAPWCREKWNRQVVELKIEDSKTKNPRYLDVAGLTQTSEIPVASILDDYWRAAGIPTVTHNEAGARVTRGDYWVVRVAMNGLMPSGFDRLIRVLSRYGEQCPDEARLMKATIVKARDRYKAFSVGSQSKRYVNVQGGASGCPKIGEMVALLQAESFKDMVSVVPGPLLRSSSGKTITHMPLSTSSTFTTTKELLSSAYRLANADSPDPDLDTQAQRLEPDWASHSLRRCSDTHARRHMNDTRFGRRPVEKWEIDLYYGWNEAEMKKGMQMHYATMGLRERLEQARITCLM
jgi:hypothetical protein